MPYQLQKCELSDVKIKLHAIKIKENFFLVMHTKHTELMEQILFPEYNHTGI